MDRQSEGWPTYQITRTVRAARIVEVRRAEGGVLVFVKDPITHKLVRFVPSFLQMARTAEVGGYATVDTRTWLRAFSRKRHFNKMSSLICTTSRKMTPEDVLEARIMLAEGEKIKVVAARFNVSYFMMTSIKAGRRWKSVQLPTSESHRQ